MGPYKSEKITQAILPLGSYCRCLFRYLFRLRIFCLLYFGAQQTRESAPVRQLDSRSGVPCQSLHRVTRQLSGLLLDVHECPTLHFRCRIYRSFVRHDCHEDLIWSVLSMKGCHFLNVENIAFYLQIKRHFSVTAVEGRALCTVIPNL